MNTIFQHYFVNDNDESWRVELLTAGDDLENHTLTSIPYDVIQSEILWECTLADNMPIGLPETPTVTVVFNLNKLQGSSALEHLRDRLISPFIQKEVSHAVANSSTVNSLVQTYSMPTVIKLAKRIENEYVEQFIGVQRITPEVRISEESHLEVEFFHFVRGCLEAVAFDIYKLSDYALFVSRGDTEPPETEADMRIFSKIVHGAIPNNTTSEGMMNIVTKVYNNFGYRFFPALEQLVSFATDVARSLLRDNNTLPGGLEYTKGIVEYARFFKMTHPSGQNKLIRDGKSSEITDLSDIVLPYEPYGDTPSDKKTLFDFLFDICEPTLGSWTAHGFGTSPLGAIRTSSHIDVDAGVIAPSSEVNLRTGVVGAAEVVSDNGDKVRFETKATGLADEDFALSPFFTNVTDELDDNASYYRGELSTNTSVVLGKLYYEFLLPLSGGGAQGLLVSVHPECYVGNILSESEQVYTSEPINERNPSTEDVNDWLLKKRKTVGLLAGIGKSVANLFGRPDQYSFEFDCDVSTASPLHVGHSIDIDQTNGKVVESYIASGNIEGIVTSCKTNIGTGRSTVTVFVYGQP
jgi:hypothetical protein